MKKFLYLLSTFLLIAIFSSVALALPFIPEASVGEGLFIKFNNKEQISPSNSISVPGSNEKEGNWGVVDVITIQLGDLTQNSQNFDSAGNPIWTTSNSFEITGIFGGITILKPGELGYNPLALNATGGWMDLYYDDTPDADLASALPSDRTSKYLFTNFTDGIFLARVEFLVGGITPGVSITGTSVPLPGAGNFTGVANSFGSIADVNGDGVIDGLDGLWAQWLDSNYFNTALGDNTADIKFRNIYEGELVPWSGGGGNDIIGASSTDPARVYVTAPIPEPATMLLLGFGLLGLAGVSRKRHEI